MDIYAGFVTEFIELLLNVALAIVSIPSHVCLNNYPFL